MSVLSAADVHSSVVSDSAGRFLALFMQTDSQRCLFQRYGDVLQLDCTCKVYTVSVIIFPSLHHHYQVAEN